MTLAFDDEAYDIMRSWRRREDTWSEKNAHGKNDLGVVLPQSVQALPEVLQLSDWGN